MESPESSRSSTSSPTLSEEIHAAEGTVAVPVNKNEMEPEVVGEDNQSVQTSPQKMMELPGAEAGVSGSVTGGIDRLLQKHRNEIMFELRHLQHGERPVTGQGNKEAVENFFSRALNETDQPSEREQNRPEHVTVEVNALVERRPVSSILTSARFRRNLESALRGAMRHLQPATPTVTRLDTTTLNGSRSSLSSGSSLNVQDNSRPAPVPHPAAQSDLPEERNLPLPPYPQTQSHHNAPERAATLPLPPPPSAGPVLGQWEPVYGDGHPSELRHRTAHDILQEGRREEFISDISELVQRQLVTSTLEGTFRNRLEHLMRNQLDTTGVDGSRVQQFIQTLPPRVTLRNDFSNLGINVDQPDSLDDISVISATAAVSVPYAQSNRAISHEMSAIKSQLNEMKQMMRLSFDLQLDIQRAIRQEVAAALSSAIAGTSLDSNTHAQGPLQASQAAAAASRPASESHCLICLEKQVDSVLYQCGHMCVCHGCGLNLRSRGSNCPVCRAPIKDIIRAYRSNQE